MSRVLNLIYGVVLIFLAFSAWFDWIPSNLVLALLVAVMGIIILMTPLGEPGYGHPLRGSPSPRPFFQWIRRWFFGGFLVLSGVSSFEPLFEILPYPLGAFLYNITLSSTTGPWIILAIGVIYFLVSFRKTRDVQLSGF